MTEGDGGEPPQSGYRQRPPGRSRPFERAWSRVTRPYCTSIRARFHLALVLALGGLVIMAGIAKTSIHVLPTRFEDAAKEAAEHMMPAHHLEMSLRNAKRLASLYLISGDKALHERFHQAAANVDRQFQRILDGRTPNTPRNATRCCAPRPNGRRRSTAPMKASGIRWNKRRRPRP